MTVHRLCYIPLFIMKTFAVVFLCFVAVSSAQVNLPVKSLLMPENVPVSEHVILPKNLAVSVLTEILKLQNKISESKLTERGKITVNINDYLDNMMSIIRTWVIRNGLDPLPVENLEKGFRVRLGLITFHGEFILDEGWMQGLGSIERAGDALMSYEDTTLNLYLPLDFATLLINYDYLAKIMNLGPRGGVEGKVKNLQILIDITINTGTLEITLNKFKILDAGRISIKFSGNILVDWLVNTLTGLATTLLHDVVIGVVQNTVRRALEDAIEQFNNSLHPKDIYLH